MTTPLFPAHPNWILDADGSPRNPNADPMCTTCKGFGVVDNGGNYGGTYLGDCPTCVLPSLKAQPSMNTPARRGAISIGLVITLSVIGLLVLGAIIVFGMYVSASNSETSLRNQFVAQQRNLHNQLDLVTKKITQTAQVSAAEVQALKDIIVGNAQARAGQGGGSLATAVTEAVPNVSIDTLKNLQNIIAGARDTYATQQALLLDIKRAHDDVRTRIPSGWFVGSRPELEAIIVTSSKVEEAFRTGVDDDTQVFPTQKPVEAK
jgi:hypothetical protein